MTLNHENHAMMDPLTRYEDFKDYDTYMEPFIGWRAWGIAVTGDKIRLRSITYPVTWNPEQEMKADCIRVPWNGKIHKEKHVAPEKECGCGIHSVTSKEDALVWQNFGPESKMGCVGEAKLWGIVYRFTRGFLSEYAYPSKLWIPHEVPLGFPIDSREIVHELRKTYRGVEVRLL